MSTPRTMIDAYLTLCQDIDAILTKYEVSDQDRAAVEESALVVGMGIREVSKHLTVTMTPVEFDGEQIADVIPNTRSN